MDNFTHSSKFIWFFAVIGILAVVVIVIAVLVVPKQTNAPVKQAANTTKKALPFKPQVTKVSSDKLPDKFPVDLPLETNAKVVDNYNATSPSGNVQATREYESVKLPEQNFALYNDYFKKNNWEVLTSSNTAADHSITVRKDKTIIQALFFQNTATKASVVRVNVTVIGGASTNAK